MRKIICFFILSMALCVGVSAQSELTYQNGVWQNGLKITPERVRALMSEDSKALKQYNNGRSLFIAGQVIAYPSAFLLGWDLGTRLAGGKGNLTLLTAGATGTILGLVMALVGEKSMKNSVLLYNVKASDNTVSYQINFGVTQMGMGFSLQF